MRNLENLATLTHVFFTPDSASDFRNANLGTNPCGEIIFASEMDLTFFNEKCIQDSTFAQLPCDAELKRLMGIE